MTKEEKKQQKEMAKEIKAINNSLSYLSKDKQAELDVLAVQKDEHVYFCGNNIYKKIYMFRPASLGNKRIAFIRALTEKYNNRIRFSICTKNRDGKLSAYMFMTVSFSAESYYEVREVIAEFEDSLIKDICNFLGITINPCTIENALTYIHMNCSGEMKKIFPEVLFGKVGAEKLFQDLSNCNAGSFFSSNRFGTVFVGKNYGMETDGINQFMQMHSGSYYIVVDFQGFTEDEQHLYDFEIRNRYSLHNETEKQHFINMTYLFTVMSETEEESRLLADKANAFYDEKGIQLMPGVNRETEIFRSCCSLGLKDFRSAQNTTPEIVGGLLL